MVITKLYDLTKNQLGFARNRVPFA